MKRKLLWSLLAVACALAVPSLARVSAAGTTTIRLGILAPAGSTWDKVFRAWNNTLTKETGGAVNFQFFMGGVAGDERDVIRKMKLGQMDAGGLTSIGLAQIARPISVLQMPGVLDDYKQLQLVREKLASDWEGMFAKEGYQLLGWGDAGFARQFAKKPIMKPEDLKSARPWVPRDDAAITELMKTIGANGVPLGIPEVFPALQTGMVDAVTVSAIAAVALQWFRYVQFVSKQAPVAVVGATIIRQEAFNHGHGQEGAHRADGPGRKRRRQGVQDAARPRHEGVRRAGYPRPEGGVGQGQRRGHQAPHRQAVDQGPARPRPRGWRQEVGLLLGPEG
jgi:TRAP-type C4-dicarboxylate transport system substrate-binding protein